MPVAFGEDVIQIRPSASNRIDIALLIFLIFLQRVDKLLWNSHAADAVFCLGFFFKSLSAFWLENASADRQGFVFEIDVGPFEPNHLASAATGEKCRLDERTDIDRLVFQSGQNVLDFSFAVNVDFFPLDWGKDQSAGITDIVIGVFHLVCKRENGTEYGGVAPDRISGHRKTISVKVLAFLVRYELNVILDVLDGEIFHVDFSIHRNKMLIDYFLVE